MNAAYGAVSERLQRLQQGLDGGAAVATEVNAAGAAAAEHASALARAAGDAASGVEAMASSVLEVARNVDALRFTAEETSSSMNEMDVSIDQVQSNANETARLSEQVARDAEIGAEAIFGLLKGIDLPKEAERLREELAVATSEIKQKKASKRL
jgi:methyl-accepting chemotaxis protein